MSTEFMNPANDLCHYGILGMKWGIRRYQNGDGTLTEEGRKRYYRPDGKLTRKGLKEWKQLFDAYGLTKEQGNQVARHNAVRGGLTAVGVAATGAALVGIGSMIRASRLASIGKPIAGALVSNMVYSLK